MAPLGFFCSGYFRFLEPNCIRLVIEFFVVSGMVLLFAGCSEPQPQFADRLVLTDPIPDNLRRPRIIDVNGDRFPDLVARKEDSVFVYANRADGSFTFPSTSAYKTALEYDPVRISVQDVGGSPLPDLVYVVGSSGKVITMLNRSGNAPDQVQFGEPRVLLRMADGLPDKGPRSQIYLERFEITDLDGDNDQDILGLLSYFQIDYVAEQYTVWWENQSEKKTTFPQFSQRISIDTSSGKPTFGRPVDVNQDGLFDLVGKETWFENQFNRRDSLSFAAHALPAGGAFRDVTGDQRPDLLYWSSGSIRWAENRVQSATDSIWDQARTVEAGLYPPRKVHVADVNEDEIPDLITVSTSADYASGLVSNSVNDNEVAWYPGRSIRDSLPAWGEKHVINEPNPHALSERPHRSVSLSEPGTIADRALAYSVAGKLYIHRLLGGSPFTGDIQNATKVTTTDWDHDGDQDVLVYSRDGNEIVAYENLQK